MIMNSFVFSSLAVACAMLVKSHADQSLLTNFIITPMAFLGGTFFPLEKMPEWIQHILYFLPLTHASNAMRSVALGKIPDLLSYIVLPVIGIAFFSFALLSVNQARD